MDEILSILWLAVMAAIFAKAVRRLSNPEEEEASDFDLMTVAEKFEVAKRTSDDLHGMEQLLTDMDTCSDDRQAVIQLSWLGDDNTVHTYDLYCDGTNTATECMRAIAERETNDLRAALAYQCDALASATRHRKNRRQNDAETIGEWLHEQAV